MRGARVPACNQRALSMWAHGCRAGHLEAALSNLRLHLDLLLRCVYLVRGRYESLGYEQGAESCSGAKTCKQCLEAPCHILNVAMLSFSPVQNLHSR